MLETFLAWCLIAALVVGAALDVRALSEPNDSAKPLGMLDLWANPKAFSLKGRRYRKLALCAYLAAGLVLLLLFVA